MNRRTPLERRQVTVLWCDIVGWSALAHQLDAEELADVIRAYRRRCATMVARHGGMVAQYVGDGVLAYFGFPRAHEDDAERAIRAALGLVSAESNGPLRSGVHIGVATGPVVVGDLSSEDADDAPADTTAEGESGISAIGDAPNLAARLQALAEPGAIVIAEPTRRLCGGVFQYQDLGRHVLKGYAEPIQAWRVTGESRILRMLSRFQALRAPALTPLVGRTSELQRLT